jgi:hypothetical protein
LAALGDCDGVCDLVLPPRRRLIEYWDDEASKTHTKGILAGLNRRPIVRQVKHMNDDGDVDHIAVAAGALVASTTFCSLSAAAKTSLGSSGM